MAEDQGNLHEASPKFRSMIASTADFRNPPAAARRSSRLAALIDSAIQLCRSCQEMRHDPMHAETRTNAGRAP
jgi:hypothetical protein